MAEQVQIGWIPIRGDSMWPALRSGDRARLEPARLDGSALAADALVPGDVVVARVGAAFVAHRFVGRLEGSRVLLRGDNCSAEDPPVTVSRLLGRVVAIERNGRILERRAWDRRAGWLGRARVWTKRKLALALRRSA
jgi:hypothetical protein